MKASDPQAILVPSGSGTSLRDVGVTHKLTSSQTGGAYYMFEAEFEPESGTRVHVHRDEDEVVHVLEGAIEIRLGTRTLQAGAGDVAHLPKHIPHALYNPLKTPLRILAIAIPGGMEGFFDEMSTAMMEPGFDETKRHSISEKYGITWLE